MLFILMGKCIFKSHLFVDCSNNTLLQSVYHPGLFTHGRWSCCHHRSKYSLGCTLCFCGNQQEEDISPTMATTPVTTTTISVPRGEVPLVHCTSHTPSLSPTHVGETAIILTLSIHLLFTFH